MLNENADEARQFLFTYFNPSEKNSIEQYEDDFITQFQLIHDEIEKANQKLCETYEEIYDFYVQTSKHRCVCCKQSTAIIGSVSCGHVLFCKDCFINNIAIILMTKTINCPVCCQCNGIEKKKISKVKPKFNESFFVFEDGIVQSLQERGILIKILQKLKSENAV